MKNIQTSEEINNNKYAPGKYMVVYNTLSDPQEEDIEIKPRTAHSDKTDRNPHKEENLDQRKLKSSQSHIRVKINPDVGKRDFKRIGESPEFEKKDMIESFVEGRLSEYKLEEENLKCYRFRYNYFISYCN